jgi:hypothetical protein
MTNTSRQAPEGRHDSPRAVACRAEGAATGFVLGPNGMYLELGGGRGSAGALGDRDWQGAGEGCGHAAEDHKD